MDSSVDAREIGFAGALNVVRAHRKICRLQRLRNIGVRKSVARQSRGIGLDHILLIVAAEGVDIGHSLNSLKLWANDPVLYGSQISQPRDFIRQTFAFIGQIRLVALPAGFAVMNVRAICLWAGVIEAVHENLAES